MTNTPKQKIDYSDKLIAMSDDQLFEACKQMIWLSAYASNNPRSAYHWQCDACYDECKRRDKREIYSKDHKETTEEAGY